MSPHLKAALIITGGAAAYVLLVFSRLLGAMMQDPNFVRGDNSWELLPLIACGIAPLLALVTAVALAFRWRWAKKIGRTAASLLVFVAVAILVSVIVAGSDESRQTTDLIWARGLAGLASLGAALGIEALLRRMPGEVA